jgi:DNA-directed RNA polymerase specialized sigma24 family protein
MTHLQEPCHSLLQALYYDRSEPSYKEISATLDIAVGSIGPTRARCLDKLRRLMEESL